MARRANVVPEHLAGGFHYACDPAVRAALVCFMGQTANRTANVMKYNLKVCCCVPESVPLSRKVEVIVGWWCE
jgi:hypothetical protein